MFAEVITMVAGGVVFAPNFSISFRCVHTILEISRRYADVSTSPLSNASLGYSSLKYLFVSFFKSESFIPLWEHKGQRTDCAITRDGNLPGKTLE